MMRRAPWPRRTQPTDDLRAAAGGRTFGWIFGLFAIALLGWGGQQFVRVRRVAAWPVSDARVERAELVMVPLRELFGSKSGHSGISYDERLRLEYRYVVDGVEYVGTALDPLAPGRRHARADQRRYPPGTRVRVHFNPARPAEAVLEAGMPGVVWGALGGGALLGWLALNLSGWPYRWYRRRRVTIRTRDA